MTDEPETVEKKPERRFAEPGDPPGPSVRPAAARPPDADSEDEHESDEAPEGPAPPTNGAPRPAAPGAGAKTAQQLFEEARQKAGAALAAGGGAGRPNVDKYFGSKLPPVCRQLGCYVTDDGKYFYCINPHCHKDKRRETKYNRRKKSVVYFFCPKCKSREIQLHLKQNQYECLDCAYAWKH